MTRIAYFGGTFDPVHSGHLAIARSVVDQFDLGEFIFLPAYHAPHKPDRVPISAYHRFAMLCLATQDEPRLSVSTIEVDKRERRFTIDTLQELNELHASDTLFFVMGADSWTEIKTWRDWEKVLLATNHIVVTRPGFEMTFGHVSDSVRERIVDTRHRSWNPGVSAEMEPRIYITDIVKYDISATELRDDLADGELEKTADIPHEVAKYIEKYELYS